MKRRTVTRSLLCAAIITGGAIASAPVDAGQAPEPMSYFTVGAVGADASTVLDGLTVEIFAGSVAVGASGTDLKSSITCTDNPNRFAGAFSVFAQASETCDVPDDGSTYTVGLAGIPAGYEGNTMCYGSFGDPSPAEVLPGDNVEFTLNQGQTVDCYLLVFPTDASFVFEVNAFGLGHEAAVGATTVEVYEDGSLVDPFDCTESAAGPTAGRYSAAATSKAGHCELTDGSYVLGLSGIPDNYDFDHVNCYRPFFGVPGEILETASAEFDIAPSQEPGPVMFCDVYLLGPPTLYTEVDVVNGPAAASDFAAHIYDGSGALVAEIVDPSDDYCTTGNDPRLTQAPAVIIALDPPVVDACGAAPVVDDTLTVDVALPDYGYDLLFADCEQPSPFGLILDERIIEDVLTFEHRYGREGSLCSLVVGYFEQTITVDVVTDNSVGGASDGSDITVEVYDNEGTLVDSGTDPTPDDDSSGAEFTLPIGDYTIGASGPDGYLFTVEITVVEQDAAGPDTEIIDDPSAQFSLTTESSAAVTVTAEGQPAPTTTTTTTTTTTIAPTTTAIGSGGVLPATGRDSTATMTWWALALVLGGGMVIMASRRRTA